MAKKFITNIDLAKNELQNVVLHKLGVAPANPAAGQEYYDTGVNRRMYFNGSIWVDALNRANHTGSQPQSTVAGLESDLAAKAPVNNANLTGTPTVPTAAAGTNTAQIASTAFTIAEISARFAANDAMTYKGAIDASANPDFPAANAGDTYRISVGGMIGGLAEPVVEAGDLIICHVDNSPSGNFLGVGDNWDIIQTNIDGAMTTAGGIFTGGIEVPYVTFNPLDGSFENNHESPTKRNLFELFEGLLSGIYPFLKLEVDADPYDGDWDGNTEVPTKTDVYQVIEALQTTSPKRYAADVGNAAATSIAVNHNLNTRDLTVCIRENASPFAMVVADVEYTSVNQITVKFSAAPALNQYRVIIAG